MSSKSIILSTAPEAFVTLITTLLNICSIYGHVYFGRRRVRNICPRTRSRRIQDEQLLPNISNATIYTCRRRLINIVVIFHVASDRKATLLSRALNIEYGTRPRGGTFIYVEVEDTHTCLNTLKYLRTSNIILFYP